jgi:hypothetical protein
LYIVRHPSASSYRSSFRSLHCVCVCVCGR